MSCVTRRVAFKLHRYSTYSARLRAVDSLDDDAETVPLPAEDYPSARLQVRAIPGGTLLFEGDTTDGVLELDPDGYVIVTLRGSVIEAWDFDAAEYDIVLFDAADEPHRFCGGLITLAPMINQSLN